MASRIQPKRKVDSLHFTDRGHFAVCDDGTIWELMEFTGLKRHWRRLPGIPGTFTKDGMVNFEFSLSEEDAENLMHCIQSCIAMNERARTAELAKVESDQNVLDAFSRDSEYLRDLMDKLKTVGGE